MRRKIGVLLFICTVVFFMAGQVCAEEGPFVSEPVTPHVFEGDLRNLPLAPEIDSSSIGTEAPILGGVVQGIRDVDGQITSEENDPLVLDTIGPLAMPAPMLNFGGIGFTGVAPPDTNGDVGPSHYIQIVNSKFIIFNKAGGILAGPSNINTLWTGFGGRCESDNDGDPIVLYDSLANRWLISQFVAFSNQCIAISRGPNPVTDGWYLYDFSTGGIANDYPKFGVWPDAYYMGSQRGYGSTSDAWAFNRTRMLSGLSATSQRFDTVGQFMLPSDLDGSTPPPAGASNVFARLVDGAEFGGLDRLELRAFHVDWVTPANSTFTALPNLNTAAFDRNLCSGYDLMGNCIPQLGTTVKLESLTAWLMYRLQYRNFGGYETLVVNHTVDADTNHAGIRWYELRKTGGVWSIYQQGTHSPDSTHRWMGSVAMDGDGNMALGYSVSSSALLPSIRYTGRLASDPLGTMPQGEATLFAGLGVQTWTSRWGDYSAMNVDPVDDCTFWYTQEYVDAAGNWQTRIGNFKFPDCGVEPPTILVHDCVIAATLTPSTLDGRWTLDCSHGNITNSGTLTNITCTNPGAVCWKMDPYIDVIEVGYESHSGHYLANGKWFASGYYFSPVVGDLSSDAPGSFRMGLHGTLDPTENSMAGPNTVLGR